MLALLTDEVIKTIADGRPDLLALLGHIRTDLDQFLQQRLTVGDY